MCTSVRGSVVGIVFAVLLVCPAMGGQGSDPVLSEFLAVNGNKAPLGPGELLDEDGESSDWIEIYNPGDQPVGLAGWTLTDDANDLEKWRFPDVTLGGHAYRVVFASGKDRRDADGELHTNFKLSAGGEYLALVKPDGFSVADSYSYPQQFANVSYGRTADVSLQEIGTELISEGAGATALIPADGSLGLSWTSVEFDDSAWLQGQTGVGFDYGALVKLDVSSMRSRNQTVYVRIACEVTDASAVDKLLLRMQFEDGFVAYLNGQEVASANAPGPDQRQWNSGATANRLDEEAVEFQDFDISDDKDLLRAGRNVLAIHGLNVTLSSSDLLILPVLVASKTETIGLPEVFEGYFPQPTPRAANNRGLAQLGPIIREVTHAPTQPMPAGELAVTARVEPTFASVSDVRLFVRLGYYAEGMPLAPEGLAMHDDGVAPDVAAGDGIYSTAVPAAFLYPGSMVRWYVRATDADGRASRDPLFPLVNDSPQYYGTVVVNPAISSQLPTLIWFTENAAAASSRTGTRASVFFDGEFYDNIFVRQRGGATVGAGSKKFVFNKGHKFRFSDEYGRVEEFNLNQNGSDPSYLRQPLGFETHRKAGCAASQSFLMLSVLNGQVDRVGIFVEQVDEEFLERNGLDPRGALYKFVQRSQITPVFNDINSGIEKKTRQNEDFSDIRAVVNGLNAPTAEQRRNFVFDNFNLPGMLDYLAARCLLQDTDDIRKNFYFYRDTEGNGEWSIFPWDKDWIFGVVGDGWTYTSHPFLGDRVHAKDGGRQWSVFLDVMYNLPETREMFLRRTRTVMDELLQAPSTPANQRFFESRIQEMYVPAKPNLGNLDGAVNSLKSYFPARRTQLYIDHNINNTASQPPGGNAGIPDSQPANVSIKFGTYDCNPASGNQDEEYIELTNPNPYAVDISGWQIAGGIEHAFLPGTVLIAGGRLYVSPNVKTFRSRTITPKGGEGRFVQGNYKGHLSNWGETLSLTDPGGRIVDTLTFIGVPSDQQRYLRVTEIMYNPAEGGSFDNEQYEFVELKNIGTTALKLDGVKFTDGISYTFQDGRNLMLAAGACIVIARNQAAFTSRYGSTINLAPGTYAGSLDNAGETIRLDDRTSSTILEFAYSDDWFAATDGQGYSLTIKNPASSDLDSWNHPGSWRASPQKNGSPGS